MLHPLVTGGSSPCRRSAGLAGGGEVHPQSRGCHLIASLSGSLKLPAPPGAAGLLAFRDATCVVRRSARARELQDRAFLGTRSAIAARSSGAAFNRIGLAIRGGPERPSRSAARLELHLTGLAAGVLENKRDGGARCDRCLGLALERIVASDGELHGLAVRSGHNEHRSAEAFR